MELFVRCIVVHCGEFAGSRWRFCMMCVVVYRDVVQRLSASLAANAHSKLTSLDLSRNSIEDRG